MLGEQIHTGHTKLGMASEQTRIDHPKLGIGGAQIRIGYPKAGMPSEQIRTGHPNLGMPGDKIFTGHSKQKSALFELKTASTPPPAILEPPVQWSKNDSFTPSAVPSRPTAPPYTTARNPHRTNTRYTAYRHKAWWGEAPDEPGP